MSDEFVGPPFGYKTVQEAMVADLNKQQEEIDALRTQLASVQAALDGYKSGVKEGADMLKENLKHVEEENIALKEKLDIAVEELEWYANKENYKGNKYCPPYNGWPWTNVDEDDGSRARTALQKLGES